MTLHRPGQRKSLRLESLETRQLLTTAFNPLASFFGSSTADPVEAPSEPETVEALPVAEEAANETVETQPTEPDAASTEEPVETDTVETDVVEPEPEAVVEETPAGDEEVPAEPDVIAPTETPIPVDETPAETEEMEETGQPVEESTEAEIVDEEPEATIEEEPVPAIPGVDCALESIECVFQDDIDAFLDRLATPGAGLETQFYIAGDVELPKLDIIGQNGISLNFMNGATVLGSQESEGAWSDTQGVVNIIESQNVAISGLVATNEHDYVIEGPSDRQISAALTVSRSSNIRLENTKLTGPGKSVFWVQGNSEVSVTEMEIDCYYFCVGVAASDLEVTGLVANQMNPAVLGDRHASVWVSSTMRDPEGRFFGTSNVTFRDSTFNRKTGEGMVSGNGGHDWRSTVTFTGRTEINRSGRAAVNPDGWLPVHQNYLGITLNLEGDYPTSLGDVTDFSEPLTMARFILHSTRDSVAPETAPLIICEGDLCLSTNEVFHGITDGPNEPASEGDTVEEVADVGSSSGQTSEDAVIATPVEPEPPVRRSSRRPRSRRPRGGGVA